MVLAWLSIVTLLASLQLAQAKDIALILNDQEREALVQMIDAAVKARGLDIANNAVVMINKINTAPVVSERKEDKTTEKP